MGSFSDPVPIFPPLGGIVFGSFSDYFRLVFGSSSDRLRIVFGSFSDRFRIRIPETSEKDLQRISNHPCKDPKRILNPTCARTAQNPKPPVERSRRDPKSIPKRSPTHTCRDPTGSQQDPKAHAWHVHGSQNDPKPHTCKDPKRILPFFLFRPWNPRNISICWKVLRNCPGCIFENT